MATRLQTLQYKAIEALNAVVECKDVSFADRCNALELVLAHLQARIEQTQPVKAKTFCGGCGNEVDPSVCGCGDSIDGTNHDGHSPVPMGCDCMRSTGTDPVDAEMAALLGL